MPKIFTHISQMMPSIHQLKLICFPFIPVLLPLILFLFFYKWLQPKSASKKKLPPCPPRLPILGNLHQFGAHPHRYLGSLTEKYGELMLIYAGSSPMLIVSSEKIVCE
uniref:Uncharacterized protein n=1 Tax=Opuntia streptacantha TaxID=393608 RepID=A0A7C9AL86_OPUST